MKFNFLKPNKSKNLPPLSSLRPQIFDVDRSWFLALGLFIVIIVITGIIGFRLFYYQYTEGYKQSGPASNFKNIIDANKLNSAIQKRGDLINQKISLPRDPSI